MVKATNNVDVPGSSLMKSLSRGWYGCCVTADEVATLHSSKGVMWEEV